MTVLNRSVTRGDVDDRSSDLMDMAFAILLKSSAVIRKAPLRNAKPQLAFPRVNVSSCSSGRTGACLLLSYPGTPGSP